MYLLTSEELLTKLGDLGVVLSNEESFQYAARMAAREMEVGKFGGKFKVPRWRSQTYTYAVSSPPSLSHISPDTSLYDHGPGHAVNTNTFAPLRTSPLPFANYLSFVFAATAASSIDVVPHSPAHPAQSSPPPARPTSDEHVDDEGTTRETIARLSDYLETHPEPIIGSIDNPFPSLDKYGIKGVSILSIFFDNLDADTFTCHLCNDKRDSINDALEHQRTARHGEPNNLQARHLAF